MTSSLESADSIIHGYFKHIKDLIPIQYLRVRNEVIKFSGKYVAATRVRITPQGHMFRQAETYRPAVLFSLSKTKRFGFVLEIWLQIL